VAVLSVLLTVIAGPARPAAAHPYLVQVVPGPGTVLREPPKAIELGLTEDAVLEGSSLRLTDAGGKEVPLGPLREPENGAGVAAGIEGELTPAVYTVDWVVLGDDGHTTSGEFSFATAQPDGTPPPGADQIAATGGPSDQQSAEEGPLRIALRWAGLLGAALLLAAVLLTRLGAGAAAARRGVRLARTGWALALAGAVAAAVAAAGAGAGGPSMSRLFSTTSGSVAAIRLVLVVLAAAVAWRLTPPRLTVLLSGAAFGYLAAEAVSGHSGAGDGKVVAGAVQVLHLAAAALWIAALVALVVAGRTALRSLAPVAGWSALVVVATGTVVALREVEHLYFLRYSTYGRYLLVKLALVAGMLGLAAGVRFLWKRGGLVRVEAAAGAGVLLVAAALAGIAPGRGQPLPAQEGSVLAGPAFANAVVGGGLARMALAPAAPGLNRLSVLTPPPLNQGEIVPPPPSDAAPGETPRHLATETTAGSISATLTCVCFPSEITVDLFAGDGAWHADVDLPAAGVWRAALTVDGQPALAPVALRVDSGHAPGAAPVVVAAPADLSAHDARRCRSFQLGLVLALGFLNAEGGIDGRKVVVASRDDGGDPGQARDVAARLLDGGARVAAPCGAGTEAATETLGGKIPVVVADPQAPLVPGPNVVRLAPDPYAEGWALARAIARNTFTVRADIPRAIAVVVDAGDPTTDRMLLGLHAGLDLDPRLADQVERPGSASTADVEVTVLVREAGGDLSPLVQQATDASRFAAAFLRNDPTDLAAALDQFDRGDLVSSSAIVVPARHFDETFYRASKVGRRGDILVLGEVSPDSDESLVYTRLTLSIFPGERPSIDGLRGFLTGRAIATALKGGTSPGGLATRLGRLGPFSSGVVSGWSPAAPDTGSWRFFLFKGSFTPAGLVPGAAPEAGRYFEEGSWSRAVTGNLGLCSPPERVEPAPCTPMKAGS
jgi:methionine-rich copper-binding protein CopC/putative copper export protein